MQKKLIENETMSTLYWLEKAIADLKDGNSAVSALLFATSHAHSLEIYKTQANCLDIEIDYPAVFVDALERAKKEIKDEE